MTNYVGYKVVDEYIDMVRHPDLPVCKDQILLCDHIERQFDQGKLRLDEEQLDKYLSYQQYFPYDLFPWEKFLFALHNCVYDVNNLLRWPDLIGFMGRGTGKNGFLSFEDFCLMTPTNGIDKYDIYLYAMSEAQAKTSWEDVYNVLESNKGKMSKHFHWNLEVIDNLDTKSKFRYCTKAPNSKDGQRPGKIDFDEYHAYTDYKLIDVATTGLGKIARPRRTIVSTNGLVRGGPFDDLLDICEKILAGEMDDNGQLPFICRLDEDDEVHHKANWHKANPSLRYFPELQQQLEREYIAYVQNPSANVSFMAKRMNRPPKTMVNEAAKWEDILATNQPIDEELLKGYPCVAGIDYMKTTDFLAAGLLYRIGDYDYWITHTWICRHSADLFRIKAPLAEWESRGMVTFVDAVEIPPELPAIWLENESAKRKSRIMKIGVDSYRYQLLAKSLREINFSADNGYDNVVLLRPSDEMRRIPLITSGFVNQKFLWGDRPDMRWYTNNSMTVVSPSGNITYGKIEPKSRKTDGFKAFVAAECVSDCLDAYSQMNQNIETKVYTY